MKLKLLLFSLIAGLTLKAGATTLTVTVQNFSFTPNSATIQLGDTVKFTWVNGEHTTTSTTIPAGAAAWDHPMTASSTTFIYVPTKTGVYNYQCTPHASMGHIGSFTVNGGTGITEYDLSKIVFDLYPNPAQTVLNVAVNNGLKAGQVLITDISGKQVMAEQKLSGETKQIDINALPQGVYFARLIQSDKAYVRKFTITR